jgi:transposase-like protein
MDLVKKDVDFIQHLFLLYLFWRDYSLKKIYPKYSIKEKNKIVEEYLNGDTGRKEILKKYQISSASVFRRWVKQYRETGTTYDKRGKSSAGRPKKSGSLNPEEMTREELIQYVKAVEDIKKFIAYQKKQNKNIK